MREISWLEPAWEEEEEVETRRKKGMRDYDSSWLFRRGDNGWGRCRAAGEREKAGDRLERRISADLASARIIGEPSNASSRNRRSREISIAGWKSRWDSRHVSSRSPIDDVPRRGRKIRGLARVGDTLILCISAGKKKKNRAIFTLVIHVISHASASCNHHEFRYLIKYIRAFIYVYLRVYLHS